MKAHENIRVAHSSPDVKQLSVAGGGTRRQAQDRTARKGALPAGTAC
jgi:hypothetical protein